MSQAGGSVMSEAGGSVMSEADAARVQQAFNAAISGDVEPLVALLAPDLEWRGVQRGHLRWRSAPS